MGYPTLTSGLYAGISMTVMWSEALRWGGGGLLLLTDVLVQFIQCLTVVDDVGTERNVNSNEQYG